MLRGVMAALAIAWLGAAPLAAQDSVSEGTTASPNGEIRPLPGTAADPTVEASNADEVVPTQATVWDPVWGLVGLRAIPAGSWIAPNGLEYHPNFSMDLNFNFWIWRSRRLYMFADVRLWGEKNEFGVTNARDGVFATSKREFDLDGGVAWNYAGPLELRAFGYTNNNLNRGSNPLAPVGYTDGFGLENRYYLSPEYARLGQTGFDVAKATFVSIGYLPSKVLVGNDGSQFYPGLTLRGYLTYNLWDWPVYLFGDGQYIGDQSFQPHLLIFDAGVAARPFRSFQQWEFRIGDESTVDLQAHNTQNLWYVALRFIF